MSVWKDHTINDAIFVTGEAVKAIKLKQKFLLCPDVVHDSTGFTMEPIKEKMNEIMDVAKKVRVKGFKIGITEKPKS